MSILLILLGCGHVFGESPQADVLHRHRQALTILPGGVNEDDALRTSGFELEEHDHAFIEHAHKNYQNPAPATAATPWLTNPSFFSTQMITVSQQCQVREWGSAANLPSSGPYTLYAEINPTQAGVFGILGWGTSTLNGANCLRLCGATCVENRWAGNDYKVPSKNLVDGAWHSIQASWNGTVQSIWIDGVLAGTRTARGHNATEKSTFCIGATTSNNVDFFQGSIQNVYVYNVALTPSALQSAIQGPTPASTRRLSEITVPPTTLTTTTTASTKTTTTTTTTTTTPSQAAASNFNGVINRPTQWYVADDYNNNLWPNRGTAGGALGVLIKGSLSKVTEADGGAQKAISSLRGNSETSLYFGNLIRNDDFTICALTRYTGAKKERILNGGGNWLFGHHGGKAGVAHMPTGWATTTDDRRQSNWVAICARGGGATANSLLVNGVAAWTGSRVIRPHGGEVVINTAGDLGTAGDEVSDFGISELIVWQGDAMQQGSAYLAQVLSNGRTLSSAPVLPAFTSFPAQPRFWFAADDYTTGATWRNRGTAGGTPTVVTKGTLNKVTEAGNGAQKAIAFVTGGVGTSLAFGSVISSNDFTLCSLTRYAGPAKARILNGAPNWLYGHWHARAGVAHTNRWNTAHSFDRAGNNWIAMCGRGNGGTAATDLLLNGAAVLGKDALERPTNGEVFINAAGATGCCGGEASDFAISELIVWEGNAMQQGMAYLNSVLANGRPAQAR